MTAPTCREMRLLENDDVENLREILVTTRYLVHLQPNAVLLRTGDTLGQREGIILHSPTVLQVWMGVHLLLCGKVVESRIVAHLRDKMQVQLPCHLVRRVVPEMTVQLEIDYGYLLPNESHDPLCPCEDAAEFGGESDFCLVFVLAPLGASSLLLRRVGFWFGFALLFVFLCLFFLRVGANDLLRA